MFKLALLSVLSLTAYYTDDALLSPKGDTAIASYVLHLTQREANKKVHTEAWQESDVWFQTGSGWKITHVHYSAAPTPKKKS